MYPYPQQKIPCGDFDKYGRLLVWVHAYEPNQAQLFGVEGMDLLEAQEGVDPDAKHVDELDKTHCLQELSR